MMPQNNAHIASQRQAVRDILYRPHSEEATSTTQFCAEGEFKNS